MTFAAVALGALVGSFLGNVGVFWVIGLMAQRAEKKQMEELKKLQDGYLEMAQKERERIENYARMES
jgi:membrane protein YqaA with SNARE-associated domain